MKSCATLVLGLLAAGAVRVAADTNVLAAAAAFLDGREMADAPAVENLAQAARWRTAYVAELEKSLGPVAGYKAGLTNPKAQQAFGVREPLLGVLLQKMLYPSGTLLTNLPAVRPLIEADLLARVGSEDINEAKTPADLLASLDAFLPFVEIPDLALATNAPLSAAVLTALNVGARAGILGDPLPVTVAADWPRTLAYFRVELKTGEGRVLGQGSGGDLLGYPMEAVTWIRDQLKAQGIRLRKGDLLSLGSLTAPAHAEAGSTYTATYYNLDRAGPVSVTVTLGAQP